VAPLLLGKGTDAVGDLGASAVRDGLRLRNQTVHQLGPDLVVEVLSPRDRPGETLAKVGDWLEGGARLVWVIDPERRLARVYRHDGSETSISEEEQLVGEDVLPGFYCRLGSIL